MRAVSEPARVLMAVRRRWSRCRRSRGGPVAVLAVLLTVAVAGVSCDGNVPVYGPLGTQQEQVLEQEGNQAEGAEASEGLQPGEVGLFLAVGTGSSDAHVENLTIHTETGAVILVVPAAGRAIEISSYSSPEYASSSVSLHKSGDRVFRLRKWESGTLDITEIDTGTGGSRGALAIFDDVAPRSFAVVGDTAYYRTQSEYDVFTGGYTGGEYFALVLGWDGSGNNYGTEIPDAQVPWGMQTDGERLYSLEKEEDRIILWRIEPGTGTIAEILGDFTITQTDQYVDGAWRFVVEDGIVYWTSLDAGTGVITLWAYRGGDLPEEVARSTGTTIDGIYSVDVDDGHFLIHANDPTTSRGYVLVLYHQESDGWEYLDFGLSVHDAYIVHLGGG